MDQRYSNEIQFMKKVWANGNFDDHCIEDIWDIMQAYSDYQNKLLKQQLENYKKRDCELKETLISWTEEYSRNGEQLIAELLNEVYKTILELQEKYK